MLTIELIESNKIIERKIMLALVAESNDIIGKAIPKIVAEIKPWTRIYLQNTEEYAALQDGGKLAAHFGIPYGQAKGQVDDIISIVEKQIDVDFNGFSLYGRKIRGELVLKLMKTDLSEILSLDYHNYVTSENTGTHIKWIEWLLTRGDDIIITDYKIEFKPGSGRSLQAIMKASPKEVWRVPSEYSGSPTYNWLTRRISSTNFVDGIYKIIQKNIS